MQYFEINEMELMHGFREYIYYNPKNAIIFYQYLYYIATHLAKNLDISEELMVQNKYYKTVYNPYLLNEILSTFPFVTNLSQDLPKNRPIPTSQIRDQNCLNSLNSA